jgi:hypothetical protein
MGRTGWGGGLVVRSIVVGGVVVALVVRNIAAGVMVVHDTVVAIDTYFRLLWE